LQILIGLLAFFGQVFNIDGEHFPQEQKEKVSQHYQSHMPMPAVPGSALKLIHAKLGLALFKILLYGPPQRRDFPNFFQRRVLRGVGDLILNSAVFELFGVKPNPASRLIIFPGFNDSD
jgi:hypothetical protein